jgi:DNA-binding CsgD family transcriptional regulator
VSSEEKMSIRTSHRNRRMGEKTAKEIEEAIYALDSMGLFVTQMEIGRHLGRTQSTISYHMNNYFRELIQEVNLKKFNTDSWNTYIKNTNTDKIVRVINEIKEIRDKASKANVSKKTLLSYNTVSNLWFEESVQEALNEYNDYVKKR